MEDKHPVCTEMEKSMLGTHFEERLVINSKVQILQVILHKYHPSLQLRYRQTYWPEIGSKCFHVLQLFFKHWIVAQSSDSNIIRGYFLSIHNASGKVSLQVKEIIRQIEYINMYVVPIQIYLVSFLTSISRVINYFDSQKSNVFRKLHRWIKKLQSQTNEDVERMHYRPLGTYLMMRSVRAIYNY